ncbi:mitochondrial chaperone [Rhizophlyctis rosea]|nr:mitochondrial chaperone [Rhizophlyctis rosea]
MARTRQSARRGRGGSMLDSNSIPRKAYKRKHVPTGGRYQQMKQTLRNSIQDGGALSPVIQMLGGSSLQAMLLAWIPMRFGEMINTGTYAIDMFVTTLIVTVFVALLTLAGTALKTIIETDSVNNKQDDVISIKVEHYRTDKYGELIVNLHYEALAWLISQRSREEMNGDFRMVPYDAETSNNGGSSGDSWDWDYYSDDGDADTSAVPDFNILPRGDFPLLIEHNNCLFTVKFEQPTDDGSSGDNQKPATAYAERKARAEPPIVIQRALEDEKERRRELALEGIEPTEDEEEQQPEPTLEWMQKTLSHITRLYLDYQSKRKSRARYERYRGGGWYRSSEIHACRGLTSVALDEPLERLLHHDLASFHNDKPFYERMGLPYRRGYLFSGKPGTGKTSLINAISATYNRDLYYINLKEVSDDAALQSAFNSVPKNSIIVFEDVDAQSAVVHSRERRVALRGLLRKAEEKRERERKEQKRLEKERKKLEKKKKKEEGNEDDSDDGEEEDKEESENKLHVPFLPQEMEDNEDNSSVIGLDGEGMGGGFGFGDLKIGRMVGFGADSMGASSLLGSFTLSTLLNCLDGHTLAEGTIIIMTTNHPEVLDPALIRPGRIDLHLGLGYCTRYQLLSMYRSVMDDAKAEVDLGMVPEMVIAPCDAMRIMVLFRHTPGVIGEKLRERAYEILDGGGQNATGVAGGAAGEGGKGKGTEVVGKKEEKSFVWSGVKKLSYKTREWTEADDKKLRSVLRKGGVPYPAWWGEYGRKNTVDPLSKTPLPYRQLFPAILDSEPEHPSKIDSPASPEEEEEGEVKEEAMEEEKEKVEGVIGNGSSCSSSDDGDEEEADAEAETRPLLEEEKEEKEEKKEEVKQEKTEVVVDKVEEKLVQSVVASVEAC